MTTGYLDPATPFPNCPGCGHVHSLRALDEALQATGLSLSELVLVTDIGCVGLADAMFPTLNTVHTLHGRSVAIAAGLHLGDHAAPKEKPIKPIVLIGDGGAGLGLLHFVHAAQMNVDITVVVHNNLVYGMTGGQHSVLTLQGMKTATTPSGSLIPPLDLGAILIGAGAGFYARTMVPGPDAAQFIAQAIRHPGFAVVEIHELCPPYATKYEGITVKDLKGLPERTGRPFGIIKEDASRRTFFDGYKVTASRLFELPAAKAIIPDPALRKLDRLTQVVIGGKAGEHVQSAASIAAAAATAAGLYVTLRSDNPVTVGTGFSIAELTLSPEPIHYMGLAQPDLVILVAEEGQRELEGKELFSRKDKTSRVVVDVTLRPPSGVQAEERDLRVRFGPKNAALGALIEEIDRVRWWDAEAWLKAFARLADKPQQDAKRVFEIIHGKEKTI